MTQQAYIQKPNEPQSLIPYSPTLGFIQDINRSASPLKYLETLSRRYGDCFRVGGRTSPVVCLSNPKAIEAVFTADPALFEVGSGHKYLQFLLGENSILMQDGAAHKRIRQLLTPVYRSIYHQYSYGQLIYIGNKLRDRVSCQGIVKEKMRTSSLGIGKRSDNQLDIRFSLAFDNT